MEENKNLKDRIINYIFTLIGVVILAFAFIFKENDFSIIIYMLSYILISYDIIFKALKHLFRKDMFDENFLMLIATIGAFCIGEYIEAVAVILLYKIGEFLQDKAVDNSKEKLRKIVNIRENNANVV